MNGPTITLGRAIGIPAYTLTSSDWRKHPGDILVQVDYDYLGVASSFGWSVSTVEESQPHSFSLPCEHGGTDGTIECAGCRTPASTFIESARDFLDGHIGAAVTDPGYFD